MTAPQSVSPGSDGALDPVAVTIHKLKTWPEYFNEVLSGRKPFEWRVDDRDFKLGDTLLLQEYIPHPENPGREGKYTGREITKTVSYIFSPWATNKRTVVMGLATPANGDEVLIRQLREMATEFAIDNKTDCKQHVCWIAADRLSRSAAIAQKEPDAGDLGRAAYQLLAAEDERQSKLHELLETIREQIRTEVAPEHRPKTLFKNIQDAVYAMRGRTLLLNDVAIVAALDAAAPQTIDSVPSCGQENDYRRTQPSQGAGNGEAANGDYVTVKVPDGYDSVWDFLNDCGLETAPQPTTAGCGRPLSCEDLSAAYFDYMTKNPMLSKRFSPTAVFAQAMIAGFDIRPKASSISSTERK